MRTAKDIRILAVYAKCGACGAYLVNDENGSYRLEPQNHDNMLVCEDCGEKHRFPAWVLNRA